MIILSKVRFFCFASIVFSKYRLSAADGLFAESMAGYIRWVAPHINELKKLFSKRHKQLRDFARRTEFNHDRTPELIANLALGVEAFLNFATSGGALTPTEAGNYWSHFWEAVGDILGSQVDHIKDQDPTERFISLLLAAFDSGKAHIIAAETEDSDPHYHARQLGWRMVNGNYGREWRKKSEISEMIGWLDNFDDLLLIPDATYAMVQRFASQQRTNIGLSQRTLWKSLAEKGMLASTDRDQIPVRWTVAGNPYKNLCYTSRK